MPFIVATYVYASTQGQRTHSALTKIGSATICNFNFWAESGGLSVVYLKLFRWRKHYDWTNWVYLISQPVEFSISSGNIYHCTENVTRLIIASMLVTTSSPRDWWSRIAVTELDASEFLIK